LADFIGVAPNPLLTEFGGTHDRVAGFFVVAAGMLVFGRIAAEHKATALADAQMYLLAPYLEAFLAAEEREVRFWDECFGGKAAEMVTTHGFWETMWFGKP